MLSFEEIEDCFPNGAVSLPDGWIGVTAQWMHDFARAIEAAVLPEGYALVSIAQLKTWGCYEALDAMCQYPLAAAPKPAQAKKQYETWTDARCAIGTCEDGMDHDPKCEKAEKQEPVNDEPVAWIDGGDLREVCNGNSRYVHCDNQGRMVPLYTHPQTDLTAEVERLKSKEFDWAKLNAKLTDRIAELEAQDTEMCDVHAQLLVEHGKAKLHIAALEEAAREAREKQ